MMAAWIWRRGLAVTAGVFLGLTSLVPAHAIIRRHDRPDALYRADPRDFPYFARIMDAPGGVLVAPEWVLTAAHTVEGVDPFSDWRVYINGRRRDVVKIILHPKRRRGDVNSDFDLALLKLAAPVTDATPAKLYRWNDEMDKSVLIIGQGATGTGLHDNQTTTRDGVLRRARQRINGVFEHSLVYIFDAPPLGEDLEGCAGAADSGAPMILEREGQAYVAGIGSTNSGDARYNTLDSYVRVSGHLGWIEETMAQDPPSTLADYPPLTLVKRTAAFPSTPAGVLARRLVEVLNAGRPRAVAEFFARSGSRTSPRTAEERATSWLEDWRKSGLQEPYGYTQSGPNSIAFLTFATKTKVWTAYLLETDPTDSGRIGAVVTGQLSGPPHSPADDH